MEKEKTIRLQISEQSRQLSIKNYLFLDGESVGDSELEKVGSLKLMKFFRIGEKSTVKSLENLDDQPNMISLRAANTQIESYSGIMKQKALKRVDFTGTPLSQRPNFRIALVVLIGPRLLEINN